MTLLKLSELLAGTEAEQLQAVGLMQLIPLVRKEPGTDVILAPLGELQVSNRQYGSIEFSNPTELDIIVPRDSAYITQRRSGQDHAVPKVVVIGAAGQIQVDNAACIQETTGGYIVKGDHEMIILPFALREQSFRLRKKSEYSKLWGTITSYNSSVGLSETGHVEVFLNAFRKQMSQFVAEFEPVPDQVGAIILVGGRIVGIERVPTAEYWLEIWETLIRDCYGSLAVYIQETNQELPETRSVIRGDPQNLAELKQALKETTELERETAKEGIDELLGGTLEVIETEENGRYHVKTLEGAGFLGQSVNDNGNVIYASLIASQERLRQSRSTVDAFRF